MLKRLKGNGRGLLKKAAPFLAVILAAWCCSRFFFQLMLIQGDSMLPAYHHLQIVAVDKRNREFSRGDVIAFRCEELSSVLVKRIAACPGETAQIRGGVLYVDGQPGTVYPETTVFEDAGLLEDAVLLGGNEYLVLGDNTGESKDSRNPEVGIVKENEIIGKVIPATDAGGREENTR